MFVEALDSTNSAVKILAIACHAVRVKVRLQDFWTENIVA